MIPECQVWWWNTKPNKRSTIKDLIKLFIITTKFAPAKFGNPIRENQEPNEDRSQNNPHPEARVSLANPHKIAAQTMFTAPAIQYWLFDRTIQRFKNWVKIQDFDLVQQNRQLRKNCNEKCFHFENTLSVRPKPKIWISSKWKIKI